MQPEDYLQSRIDDQITWYNAKSAHNKRWYYTCQIIVLIAGALIPLLTGYMDDVAWLQYITGTLGGVIVVFQGLMSLKKYKDNWLTYRTTAETLQREKLMYQTGADPYDTAGEPFKLFVRNAESIMASENQGWKGLREKEKGEE